MAAHLSYFIKLSPLSSGRRLFSLRRMRDAAVSLNDKELVPEVDMAMAHDRKTHDLDMLWEAKKKNPAGSVVPELDNRVDRTVTGLRDGALAQASGALPGDDIANKVEHFVSTLFPAGVFAVTSLPFVEELAAVEGILHKLQNELAPLVVELGLTRQAERLAELTEAYGEALIDPDAALDFPTVEEARARGQRHLLRLVAIVLARYPEDTPAHEAAREALLGPVVEQQEAVRAYLRARRAVRDVDPETGSEVDGEVPDSDLLLGDAPVAAPAAPDTPALA